MPRLLTMVAVNAVPVAGWFIEDWSAGTTLAVYWFENVAGSLCMAILIATHQRLSPRRGHFRYQAPDRRGSQTSSFLNGFLVTSLAFCAAHGVFLGTILLLLNHNGESRLADVDWRSVGIGCVMVLAFLTVDLAADLVRVRNWPFLQIEQSAYRGLGRVVVVHLTLISGLLAVPVTGASSALFGVFVVLKTLYALGTVLPQWEPATPPRWFSRIMNRLPNVYPGKRFEDFWVAERADEANRRDRNEQPWASS
jgi:Family of unknown function (DUF6498)